MAWIDLPARDEPSGPERRLGPAAARRLRKRRDIADTTPAATGSFATLDEHGNGMPATGVVRRGRAAPRTSAHEQPASRAAMARSYSSQLKLRLGPTKLMPYRNQSSCSDETRSQGR